MILCHNSPVKSCWVGTIKQIRNIAQLKWAAIWFKSDCPLPEPPFIDIDLVNVITLEDIQKLLNHAKNNKNAVSFDANPVDITRNDSSAFRTHAVYPGLLITCFDSGMIPEVWFCRIINSIPTCSTLDRQDLMNYQAITLASAVYKLNIGVLNYCLNV